MTETTVKQKREKVLGGLAIFCILLATICSVSLTAAFVAAVVWLWKVVLSV